MWLCRVQSIVLSIFVIMFNATVSSAACDPEKTLGVSRVITVPAEGGQRYGKLQYSKTLPLEQGEVVLTFDDGPHPKNTTAILKALEEHCTKATFFPVGVMIRTYPKVLKKVADAGHTIGVHTHTHPRMPFIPFEHAKLEIERGFAEAVQAIGRPVAPFFRYPGLRHSKKLNKYLRNRNVAVMSVDILSFDTRDRNMRSIIHNTLQQLKKRGRGMILLHDLQTTTARAVPALLDALKKHGYKVVHIVPVNEQRIAVAHYTPSPKDKYIFRKRYYAKKSYREFKEKEKKDRKKRRRRFRYIPKFDDVFNAS